MKQNFFLFRDGPQWIYRIYFTLFILLISASFTVAGQEQKSVNLDMKNVNLSEVLEQIKTQTGLSVMFSNDDIRNIATKNYLIVGATLQEALQQVLKDTGLEYEITNDVIIIRKAGDAILATQLFQATKIVSGTVMDVDGDPLPGVTVILKGTTIGTSTNAKGYFELRIPESSEPTVLIFSFVGMITIEKIYVGNEPITVVMEHDVAQVGEVVVTGIFDRKADTYTGAVQTFKREDLQRVGNQNILHSLKNLDPSFQVIENNDYGSDPNRMPEIQMRGASNFSDMKDKYQSNPNQPLFVVDGFEQSIEKVMDMDMNRISSITLLKDATAKALYGSKGANGVVVIETIVPDPGRLKMHYNGNLNIQVPDLNSYNLANAAEKLEIEKNAGIYDDPYGNPLTQYNYDKKYNEIRNEVLRGVDTYWLKKPLRVGVGHKHTLTFEGGDDIIRYGIDFQYNNVAGVMKESNREVISAGFNFQYRYKSLIFREQLSVTFNKAKESPYGNFSTWAKMNPYWRDKNEDGSIKEVIGIYAIANFQGSKNIYNPLINVGLNTKNQSTYTDFTNNFYVEWLAFEGMRFKGRLGITSQRSDSEFFLPRDHTRFRDIEIGTDEYFTRGLYTMGHGKKFEYAADITANYSRQVDKHLIFANAQWSAGERKNESVLFSAQGFGNNKADYITQAKEYVDGAPTGAESVSRDVSVLASVNYSYDDRYLLDATYRTNASSLFGTDKKWGQFWSAGVGWNIHNEIFMPEFIERLRVRASTGFSGSQNFNSYQALATYKYVNDVYDNIMASTLLGLPNPDLRWQKTKDNNIGVDINILNRLDVSVDFYEKITDNLLAPVSMPPSAGFSQYTENLGQTKNRGFELKTNVNLIRNSERQLFFSLFGTMMHNKNKISKISDALNNINQDRDKIKGDAGGGNPNLEENSAITKPSVRYAEGQSIDAIWAVKSLGLDPANGREVFLTPEGEQVYGWRATNQVVVGDKLPKVSGTFGFNFEYQGITVNTSFYYRLGGQLYNQTLVDKVENVDIQYNVDRRMLTDRWNPETPGVPGRFRNYSPYDALTRPTSRFVQDLNELQMTSLNIGYDFRHVNFLKNRAIERLRLQFYMNDVFRVSTIKAERGIEYPFARSFSFALQATF